MRPREFDHDEVLRIAFDQFWRRGVRGTSLSDIARDAGIQRGSLYNAFGDKRTLYAHALNRYLDQTFRERIRRFEPSLPPREAIATDVVAMLQDLANKGFLTEAREKTP